jgi:Uri superfamily endonuclease
MKRITILGDCEQSGSYLLRMRVKCELMVRFGRFQGGRPIAVPKGDVVYVGSAMAQQGSMTLARRLLRHATRGDGRNPQPLRGVMMSVFKDEGLGDAQLRPPKNKKLFWNIDYLLEEAEVELSHIVIMRSRTRFEDELAQFLAVAPGSSILAKGLGAHDRRGDTHMFMIRKTAEWWRQLPVRMERHLQKRSLKD